MSGLLAAPACETRTCTLVGCVDGASITLAPTGGVLRDGDYALDLLAGNESKSCTFRVPDDLPAAGSSRPVVCSPALDASLVAAPASVPGTANVVIRLQSTPARFEVFLARNSELVVEVDQPLAYQESRPNGEGCGPICRNGSATIPIP